MILQCWLNVVKGHAKLRARTMGGGFSLYWTSEALLRNEAQYFAQLARGLLCFYRANDNKVAKRSGSIDIIAR